MPILAALVDQVVEEPCIIKVRDRVALVTPLLSVLLKEAMVDQALAQEVIT
tara:strand:- start:378 stop:530 length:153 start_codon:yes stop_codon:yes gene_type:complete